jgi:hypothetical protein
MLTYAHRRHHQQEPIAARDTLSPADLRRRLSIGQQRYLIGVIDADSIPRNVGPDRLATHRRRASSGKASAAASEMPGRKKHPSKPNATASRRGKPWRLLRVCGHATKTVQARLRQSYSASRIQKFSVGRGHVRQTPPAQGYAPPRQAE